MRDEIQLELTSADIPGALDALAQKGIWIRNAVSRDPLTLCFCVERKDWGRVQEILDARGDRTKPAASTGPYRIRNQLVRHWVLLFGIIGILILTILLPTRVLFIQVEGNTRIPTREILDKASQCGIFFWADRGAVRSERVKNALLDAIPQLEWAGVNTQGSVAVIHVQERQAIMTPPSDLPGSMVAVRDGVIREITVLEGTACAVPGTAVKEGDVLISGYQDCGGVLLQTGAKGEVYGETRRLIVGRTPGNALVRGDDGAEKTYFSLIVGKNRINFYEDSGILDTSCVKMYLEYWLTLPGGLTLPVALVQQVATAYETQVQDISPEQLRQVLADASDAYVASRMNAGRVLQQFRFYGQYRCETNYTCLEMMGRMIYEENEWDYGENHRENG